MWKQFNPPEQIVSCLPGTYIKTIYRGSDGEQQELTGMLIDISKRDIFVLSKDHIGVWIVVYPNGIIGIGNFS